MRANERDLTENKTSMIEIVVLLTQMLLQKNPQGIKIFGRLDTEELAIAVNQTHRD